MFKNSKNLPKTQGEISKNLKFPANPLSSKGRKTFKKAWSRFSDSCGYDNLTTIKLLLYLPFVNWWKTLIETLNLRDFNFKAYQMGRKIFTIYNVYFKQRGKRIMIWIWSPQNNSTPIHKDSYISLPFPPLLVIFMRIKNFLGQTLAFIVSINTTHGKDFHLVQYDFLWYLPLLSF